MAAIVGTNLRLQRATAVRVEALSLRVSRWRSTAHRHLHRSSLIQRGPIVGITRSRHWLLPGHRLTRIIVLVLLLQLRFLLPRDAENETIQASIVLLELAKILVRHHGRCLLVAIHRLRLHRQRLHAVIGMLNWEDWE